MSYDEFQKSQSILKYKSFKSSGNKGDLDETTKRAYYNTFIEIFKIKLKVNPANNQS